MKPVIGIDLDGTILDCRTRQEAVLLQLVPQARLVADAIWTLKRSGLSTKAALARMELRYSDDFDALWFSQIEAEAFLRLDAPLPGSIPALAALQTFATLHLITARRNSSGLHDTLKRLNLVMYFDEIVIVPSGPGAAGHKAEHLRKSKACGLCGDSEVDGDAAGEAGIAFWAVASGQRSMEFLAERTRAACLLASLEEFGGIFPDMVGNA